MFQTTIETKQNNKLILQQNCSC